MRKIAVSKWKAKSAEGGDVEDSTLSMLSIVISSTRPEEMPRGLDNFRLFKRLSNAFEKAETNGILELEETDYSFLKRMVEKGVPSMWAMNKNINEAVELFLSAKEE